MVKDLTTVRRMIANKYSNRPPFDIKKIDSSTLTENQQSNNDEIANLEPCKNCISTRNTGAQKTYLSVAKYLNNRIQKNQISKAQNTVIPKVIESFQKVAPSKKYENSINSINNRSRNMSIQTLYRNNNIRFGKNLPDHQAMKDLLRNLESDDDHSANIVPIDEIPTKETFVVCNKHKLNVKVTEKKPEPKISLNIYNSRVDKKTSTTGLKWVPGEPLKFHAMPKFVECEQFVVKPKKLVHKPRHCKGHIRATRHIKEAPLEVPNKSINNSTQSLYFEEQYPTRENEKIETFSKYKTHEKPTKLESKEGSRIVPNRVRQKSFVLEQVEKLNKMSKLNNNVVKKPRSGKKMMSYEESKNITPNYIKLMNRVKKNVPQMHRVNVLTQKNNEIPESEWSDTGIKSCHDVRFPKETKHAMERLKVEKVPLTKFSKNHETFQPAIRKEKFDELAGGDKSCFINEKLKTPCSKNLLCQLGYHEGPCKVNNNKARKK